MKETNFISGLILGAIGGAILGVLFAPGKGTETRVMIAKKGSDFAASLKSKSKKKAEEWSSDVSNFRNETPDWAETDLEDFSNYGEKSLSTF